MIRAIRRLTDGHREHEADDTVYAYATCVRNTNRWRLRWLSCEECGPHGDGETNEPGEAVAKATLTYNGRIDAFGVEAFSGTQETQKHGRSLLGVPKAPKRPHPDVVRGVRASPANRCSGVDSRTSPNTSKHRKRTEQSTPRRQPESPRRSWTKVNDDGRTVVVLLPRMRIAWSRFARESLSAAISANSASRWLNSATTRNAKH